MSEYIEREKVIEILKRNPIGAWPGCLIYSEEIESAMNEIDDLPAADVEPVRHGKWTDAVSGCWHCSVCLHGILLDGAEEYVFSNYCPNCGAKMDLEESDGV